MLATLLGLIAPPRCALCARSCESRQQLCRGCEHGLARLTPRWARIPGIDAAWSAAPYDSVARELVVALKFAARLPLARRAGMLIAARAPADLLEGTIVPLPPPPPPRGGGGVDPPGPITGARAV